MITPNHRNYVKAMLRDLLNVLTPKNAVLPIMVGPATGLCVPRDTAFATPSILFGLYEKAAMQAILSIARPTQVAYDIGANVGLTTLMIAKAFGAGVKIMAFEPVPENVSKLDALVAANPGLDITLFPIALSERNGETNFFRYLGSSTGMLGATAVSDHGHISEPELEPVRTVTLDSFVLEEGHLPPEFIKIDVEGGENLVIAGGLRTIGRYRPTMLIELHGPKHAGEVWDLLADQHYEWKYVDPKLGPAKSIEGRSQLLGYFGPGDRWTQHVLLR
jgi:FkbM family methyltransferase